MIRVRLQSKEPALMRRRLNAQTQRQPASRDPDLFDWSDVSLHVQAGPAEENERCFLCVGRGRIESLPSQATSAKISPFNLLHCQLTLPFAPPAHSNVVRLVAGPRRAYLDYGVYDSFYDVPSAAKVALKLQAHNIFLIGQLVQLSEDDLRAYPFMTERALQAMKQELALFDLSFGMRAPGWNRRFNFPAASAG